MDKETENLKKDYLLDPSLIQNLFQSHYQDLAILKILLSRLIKGWIKSIRTNHLLMKRANQRIKLRWIMKLMKKMSLREKLFKKLFKILKFKIEKFNNIIKLT